MTRSRLFASCYLFLATPLSSSVVPSFTGFFVECWEPSSIRIGDLAEDDSNDDEKEKKTE